MTSPTLRILSAGAIAPGVHAAGAAFGHANGAGIEVRFATAPVLTEQRGLAARVDVVFAPPAVLKALGEAGELAGPTVPLGRVGAGIVVREGAVPPKVDTEDQLRALIAGAPAIVINRASTGKYVDRLLERWSLTGLPVTRHPDGEAVMQDLLVRPGEAIGFGAITEILEYAGRGLVLAGPLPADVQNYTDYAASLVRGGEQEQLASVLLSFLDSDAGRAAFQCGGIEPPISA